MPPRELTMPKLSDSMADAVILRWLKSAGEDFARGEGLIEVETDKATVVYEAEWDGTLGSILVPEGATVAVGEPIATLANGDGDGGAGKKPQTVHSQSERLPPHPVALQPDAEAPPDGRAPERPVATPVARRTAVELGVSLHGLTGTGPGGRITVDDVTKAAAEAGPALASVEPAVSGKGEVTVLSRPRRRPRSHAGCSRRRRRSRSSPSRPMSTCPRSWRLGARRATGARTRRR